MGWVVRFASCMTRTAPALHPSSGLHLPADVHRHGLPRALHEVRFFEGPALQPSAVDLAAAPPCITFRTSLPGCALRRRCFQPLPSWCCCHTFFCPTATACLLPWLDGCSSSPPPRSTSPRLLTTCCTSMFRPLPLCWLQLQPRLAVPGHRGGADGAGCGERGDGGQPGPPHAALLVSLTWAAAALGGWAGQNQGRQFSSGWLAGPCACSPNCSPACAAPFSCRRPEDVAWNPRHLMLASTGGYGRDGQGVEYGEIEFRWR